MSSPHKKEIGIFTIFKYCELLNLEPIWGFAIEKYLMFMKNSMRTLKITGRDRTRIIPHILIPL